MVEDRRYIVSSSGGGNAGSSGNSAGYNLHRKKIGGGSKVGGASDDIRGVCKGCRLLVVRAQEGHMVVSIVVGDTAQGNLGVNLAGIQ